MFQIFGRKFRSNQYEPLNPIVKGITDVQIFFFTIHGKTHWHIEMICIDAIGTITITFKKMKISECNSWIFLKRKLLPFYSSYLFEKAQRPEVCFCNSYFIITHRKKKTYIPRDQYMRSFEILIIVSFPIKDDVLCRSCIFWNDLQSWPDFGLFLVGLHKTCLTNFFAKYYSRYK
jgi:hypothetical protein